MPQLFHQRVTTQDGELVVHLTLDLNINVNASGVTVSTEAAEEEKTEWEVPTFGPASKVKFGKIEGE